MESLTVENIDSSTLTIRCRQHERRWYVSESIGGRAEFTSSQQTEISLYGERRLPSCLPARVVIKSRSPIFIVVGDSTILNTSVVPL